MCYGAWDVLSGVVSSQSSDTVELSKWHSEGHRDTVELSKGLWPMMLCWNPGMLSPFILTIVNIDLLDFENDTRYLEKSEACHPIFVFVNVIATMYNVIANNSNCIDFNPIQGGGGPNRPPLSRICVYACVYANTRANFFWQFLILIEEVGGTLLAQQKFTV